MKPMTCLERVVYRYHRPGGATTNEVPPKSGIIITAVPGTNNAAFCAAVCSMRGHTTQTAPDYMSRGVGGGGVGRTQKHEGGMKGDMKDGQARARRGLRVCVNIRAGFL